MIEDYQIIDNWQRDYLINDVRHALSMGWIPLGAPFKADRDWCQAMVKLPEPVTQSMGFTDWAEAMKIVNQN